MTAPRYVLLGLVLLVVWVGFLAAATVLVLVDAPQVFVNVLVVVGLVAGLGTAFAGGFIMARRS